MRGGKRTRRSSRHWPTVDMITSWDIPLLVSAFDFIVMLVAIIGIDLFVRMLYREFCIWRVR